MRHQIAVILITSCSLLAGCAGTSAIVQSEYRLAQHEKLSLQLKPSPEVSEQGMQILQQRLAGQLSGQNLLATAGDGSSRVLEVSILHYYMRHGAARALAGIMAGTDKVQSRVQIKDRATGQVLSEFNVESKNPTAWGTSKGMLEQHADKIVETLTKARH